jgi:hypothetical protein
MLPAEVRRGRPRYATRQCPDFAFDDTAGLPPRADLEADAQGRRAQADEVPRVRRFVARHMGDPLLDGKRPAVALAALARRKPS